MRAARDMKGEWGLEVSEATLQAVTRREGLMVVGMGGASLSSVDPSRPG